MARVSLSAVSKRFGDVVAVDDANIEAKDKEFVVLLGPSGCGKTTTLRCIAGLETPDEGNIYIGDALVNELPPKDRDVAMVFQSYALYPHMTVYDNIAFPLKMRKIRKEEIAKRVRHTAELLRITHLLNRKPKQLSGGEAQRTALGRAIIREPKVFLMDEPLSNLDAKLRLYMRAELKRLQKDLGVTTVYVTHDQAEAMTMADRIAIMNFGVVQQFATPSDIYNHPANMFVAGFIGSPPMNFTDCTLKEEKGKFVLKAEAFTLPIPIAIGKKVKEEATSSELVLGVRPENITVRKEPTPGSVEAEVYVVEPLGSEIIVDARVGESLFKVRTAPDFVLNVGSKIWLKFDMDKIHIFDKKTKVTIV